MEETNLSDMKTCPHCSETVKADAKNCSYCGRDVDPKRLKGEKRPAYFTLGSVMLIVGLLTMEHKFGTVLILLGLCFILFALFSGNI